MPNDNREYNYLTYATDLENYEDKITQLKNKNLIDSYYTKETLTEELSLRLKQENVHTELTNFIQSNLVPFILMEYFYDVLAKKGVRIIRAPLNAMLKNM